MKTFKEYVTMNEKASTKKGTDLKVGDVILFGRDNAPHEVTSKPKKDVVGWYVEVLNLSNKRKDRIYIDGGTFTMNENNFDMKSEVLNESTLTFDRVTPLDSKGRKAITYKDSEGRESYPVEFSPKMIDEKKLVAAVRKILG